MTKLELENAIKESIENNETFDVLMEKLQDKAEPDYIEEIYEGIIEVIQQEQDMLDIHDEMVEMYDDDEYYYED